MRNLVLFVQIAILRIVLLVMVPKLSQSSQAIDKSKSILIKMSRDNGKNFLGTGREFTECAVVRVKKSVEEYLIQK